jgi:uncharacterized membrane protein YbaN (DUF454 family)
MTRNLKIFRADFRDRPVSCTLTEHPTPTETAAPVRLHGWRRGLYIGLGCFFVVLAVFGAILPILPCTPFLLLASYFFVRSSPALNDRLLRSRLFGPMIVDWQTHRGVRRHVKYAALSTMPLVMVGSAYFGDLSWFLLVLLFTLGAIGMFVVIRLPVIEDLLHKSQTPNDKSQTNNK